METLGNSDQASETITYFTVVIDKKNKVIRDLGKLVRKYRLELRRAREVELDLLTEVTRLEEELYSMTEQLSYAQEELYDIKEGLVNDDA